MILEQQLFRNYNELYQLILCCYKDISILKVYENMQKDKSDLYNMFLHISNHFVVLLQKDLALTLWKISFDTNPNANTVSKFRNAIYKKLRDSDCNYKQLKNEKIEKSVEDKLKELRRQFLAHTDMKRNSNRIEISDLKELLDIKYREFNSICDVVDDNRIISINEMDIAQQDILYSTELFALYNQV